MTEKRAMIQRCPNCGHATGAPCYEAQCEVCYEVFNTTRTDTRYCSSRCRTAACRRRAKERQAHHQERAT